MQSDTNGLTSLFYEFARVLEHSRGRRRDAAALRHFGPAAPLAAVPLADLPEDRARILRDVRRARDDDRNRRGIAEEDDEVPGPLDDPRGDGLQAGRMPARHWGTAGPPAP